MKRYTHVFSPFKFGKVEIKNRIEVSPMLSCMATPDGFVTREMIEFYRAMAKGGAGIVTVGDVAVDSEYAPGRFFQLVLSDDRIIGGLSTMVESIQRYGAKLSLELNHAGRLASPGVINGKNPIGPSPIPPVREEKAARREGRKIIQVQQMNQDMIDEVVEHFADACYRCMAAGLEMVMIHGGHGQLLGQFVSPYTNKRTDHYGGSLENRARFVNEVLTAIRRRVGDRLAIEYRISGNEFIPGGMDEEQTIEFIKIIQDKVDLIHVSLGTVDSPADAPYVMQPTYYPNAHNVNRAEQIKKAIKIPVNCVGSIMDIETAEKILAEGKADVIAMARAILADSEIVNKSYRGQIGDIRPCIRCGSCTIRAAGISPTRCAINPVRGREVEYGYIRPADRKKKVVVVGGGPAGMEAAIVAASRGHQVKLFEKEKEMGGSLRAAAGPLFKKDMKKYLDWLIENTQKVVDIKSSAEATPDLIKAEKPDVLVIATGAMPIIPTVPGVGKDHVQIAKDVVLGKAKIGNNVAVVGAGLTGCETALFLAQQKKKVTIIDMISESEIAKDAPISPKAGLMALLAQNNVVFKMEMKLERINDHSIVAIDKKWIRHKIPADTVVLCLGYESNREKVRSFQEVECEVYDIGDCSNPRNLMAAIHSAFNIAVEI